MGYQEIIDYVLKFAAIGAGVGFVYGQFFSNREKGKDKLMDDLRDRLEVAEKVIESLKKDLVEFKEKIEEQSELIDKYQRKIKEYTEILQGKDPEVGQLIKLNHAILIDVKHYMESDLEWKKSLSINKKS